MTFLLNLTHTTAQRARLEAENLILRQQLVVLRKIIQVVAKDHAL